MTTTTAAPMTQHIGDERHPVKAIVFFHEAPPPEPVPAKGVPESERMLPVGEVATRLGCSRRHVTDLIDQGELAAVRVSPKCWSIAPADLETFIALRKSKGVVVTVAARKRR